MSNKTGRMFRVSGWVSMSVTKDIHARSKKEAREKFLELQAPALCYQCSGAGDGYDDMFVLNGFDDNLHATDIEEI